MDELAQTINRSIKKWRKKSTWCTHTHTHTHTCTHTHTHIYKGEKMASKRLWVGGKSRVSADRPRCRVLAQSLTRSVSARRYICVPYLDSSTGSRVTHVYDEDREPEEIKRASLSRHRVRNAGFISATITRGACCHLMA